MFCGCGGFALGAHSAGLGRVVALDIDPILTSSVSKNFATTKLILTDLSSIRGEEIVQIAGDSVLGVFGGPPCQAFSDIGHRRLDDPRRTLLGHFFRIVAELRPAFFVMENVRGLAYTDVRPVLDEALSLVAGRYKLVGPMVLDAADYGAATRRGRLFVIGYDPTRCDPLTPADLAAAKRKPATVRDAIGDLSSAMPRGEFDGFDVWQLRKPRSENAYRDCLRADDLRFTGHRQTQHSKEVVQRFDAVKGGEYDAVGRHPRLEWNGLCPTLRAGTGKERGSYQSVRPIHPEEARVITVREGARMQGFPDWFKFHPTVWHSFRMIGNSVSPIIARAIFTLLKARTDMPAGLRQAAE